LRTSYYFYITKTAEFDFFLSSKRYFCLDIPSSITEQGVTIFFINQMRYILSIKSVYISKEGSMTYTYFITIFDLLCSHVSTYVLLTMDRFSRYAEGRCTTTRDMHFKCLKKFQQYNNSFFPGYSTSHENGSIS
jgi:hypothetical protein